MDYSKRDKTLTQYLSELSSAAPTPGGGSVAGITASLGAGLICKVASLTVGKEKYKSVELEMQNILKRAKEFREKFSKLAIEDEEAYKKLSDVFKLPKDERKDRINEALKDAIDVPLKVCKAAHGAIKLCIPLIQKGNKNLITDTGIASLMLKCAFESAMLNVEINLKYIKEPAFILKIGNTLKPMEENIDAINEEVENEVEVYLAK